MSLGHQTAHGPSLPSPSSGVHVIAITRSKCGIPISDIFFANKVKDGPTNSPLCFFQQTTEQHQHFKPVQTSVIDLSAPIEEISAPISKNTRYKIQRAEREGFTPRLTQDPSNEEASLYAHYYDTLHDKKDFLCATAKSLTHCAPAPPFSSPRSLTTRVIFYPLMRT